MVLQQSHPVSRKAQSPGLDTTRILGISSTMALNVLALAFLLMPMTLPSLPAVVETPRSLEVVDVVPIKPITPPPPEKVEVVRPRPQPQPEAVRRVVEPQPVSDAPVLVEQGIFQPEVSDTPVTVDAAPTLEPAGPVTGMQLQYRTAPPPTYPRLAVQRNYQGTVLLRILVDVDGRPLEVSIERSSGHSVLDREAARHVQRSWRFQPAMRDGRAVQAVGIVPIDFRLDRG